MNDETGYPETLIEAVKYFASGDNALNFMVKLRWPDGVHCPTCGRTDPRFMATEEKLDRIAAIIDKCWPEQIAPDALFDPALVAQVRRARTALLKECDLHEEYRMESA